MTDDSTIVYVDFGQHTTDPSRLSQAELFRQWSNDPRTTKVSAGVVRTAVVNILVTLQANPTTRTTQRSVVKLPIDWSILTNEQMSCEEFMQRTARTLTRILGRIVSASQPDHDKHSYIFYSL